MPFFSIITSTYNAAPILPRLLDSLASQTCRDFELIIQDGASKDETLAICERYRISLPFLSVASEPDSGIYDAWNRAVRRIRGRWVIFLGADDTLIDVTTLEDVRAILESQPQSILFGAGDIIVCEDGADLFVMPGLDKEVAAQMRRGAPAVHSGLFQRAHLFLGKPFDTTFAVVGDYDFVTRLWKRDDDGVHLGVVVTRMSVGGATSNLRTILRYRFEIVRVIRRYFGWRATFPHLPGLVKGLFPFALSRLLSPQQAVFLYNAMRKARNLPPLPVK